MLRPFFWTLCAILVACAPVGRTPGYAGGVNGGALAGTITVEVRGEDDVPIAGASVDVGATAVTTNASGIATLPTTAASVTLHVSALGRVTERWIGVDRDHAWVYLATPTAPRTLTGAIAIGSSDVVLSAATTLSMLRTSSPLGSARPCASGTCELTVTVESPQPDLDVVIVDASAARLAADVHVGTDGRFAIESASLSDAVRLTTLTVTIPAAPGLEGVVGVPGLARVDGVALFPAFAPTAINTTVPAREGAFANDRLWYVARATNADGSGESMILDRHVGDDGVVHLPSTFLAIPSATASGTVGIDVDPEVDLYVVEAFAGDAVERALVLHPSGSHIDVPIALTGASRVVVRAVDTTRDMPSLDLADAERAANRIATLEL